MDEDAPALPPVVITVQGELDAADLSWADDVQRALDDGATQVVVDLLNVTFIDSSVVRTLLLLHRRLPDGGELRLVYTHHLISRVITIVGLADLFPQFPTVAAALRNSARGGSDDVSSRVDQGQTAIRTRTGTSQPNEEA